MYYDSHEPLLGIDAFDPSSNFPFTICEEKRGGRTGRVEESNMIESFGRGHDVEVSVGASE